MTTKPLPFALVAAVAGLAACSKGPPSPQENVAAAPAQALERYAFVCDDGRILSIVYPDNDTAEMRVDGQPHTLKIAMSGSGARYTGEGLQWWSKGDEGMLAALKPGEDVADPGVRCVPPARAPVSPPEPGTPGGLPDDRTPLAEGPAAPESAQAAATVVETYYALLETGKTADAANLRVDARPENLAPYASYHAQVGAPGQVEGAAGSLYVEVPVVTYGRLADGQAFHRSGKVTLRRVNDVPGATPAQLRWRISSIDLTG